MEDNKKCLIVGGHKTFQCTVVAVAVLVVHTLEAAAAVVAAEMVVADYISILEPDVYWIWEVTYGMDLEALPYSGPFHVVHMMFRMLLISLFRQTLVLIYMENKILYIVSLMDLQLKKIEEIERIKDQEEEDRYFKKYADIFALTYRFLKKRQVMLYGGMAINELLPPKLKFYAPNALPDIDVLVPNALKLANSAVKYFKQHGYDNIATNHVEALHEGTYKVFIDSVQVLDITEIAPKTFKRLMKNAVLSPGLQIYVVDPQYLRMTMHLILSKGDAMTVHRWAKVLERIILFYKQYPPKPCYLKPSKNHKPPVPDEVNNAIYKVLTGTDYVLFGLHEIEIMLEKKVHNRLNANIPIVQMFADQPENQLAESARDLFDKVKKHLQGAAGAGSAAATFKVSRVYPADEFLPSHVLISYNGTHVASMFSAEECEGYNVYKGLRIASIHTVIRMFLCMTLTSYDHFAKYIHSLECVANILTILLHKNRITKGSHKKLFQDVVSQCYGSNIGLVTMKRQRLMRLKNPEKLA